MVEFGFIDSIKVNGKNSVIGEVKCRSPVHGDLLRGRDPLKIAEIYEKCGCSAISYITAKTFGGSIYALKAICKSTNLPVLRKDFVESKDEVEKTCEAEASALLLIARILKEKTLEFVDLCFEHGVEPVVEVFSEEELRFAENARVVLINNRDIFNPNDVDVGRTMKIAPKIKKTKISGSGLRKIEDLRVLRFVDAVLVGTAFMLAEDTEKIVRSFVEARL
uniref:indole-3-glycerol-phosphate synthase n=1 Tax=Archaeoglobus fulgidus TaxID=2234 RepID=A0A7J3M155_ARCFL